MGEKVLSKGNTQGFPDGSVIKNPPLNAGAAHDHRFNPQVGKSSWSRKWQLTPVFFPGRSHGQRSMAGYSPRGCKEWDTTEATQHAHMIHWELHIMLKNVGCSVA